MKISISCTPSRAFAKRKALICLGGDINNVIWHQDGRRRARDARTRARARAHRLRVASPRAARAPLAPPRWRTAPRAHRPRHSIIISLIPRAFSIRAFCTLPRTPPHTTRALFYCARTSSPMTKTNVSWRQINSMSGDGVISTGRK